MKPLVAIDRRGPDSWSYRIGTATDAGASVVTPPDSAFGLLEFSSLERCLADLGDALGPYFQHVELQFAGRPLGACPTRLLRSASRDLAARMQSAGVMA